MFNPQHHRQSMRDRRNSGYALDYHIPGRKGVRTKSTLPSAIATTGEAFTIARCLDYTTAWEMCFAKGSFI
jgi:hypothetical protein